MGIPNEGSIFCRNNDCGVFNLPEPYCVDCAKEIMENAGINKDTIKKVIKLLYPDDYLLVY